MKIFCSLTVLVLIFFSCESFENNKDVSSVLDYYPLAEGNYWIYSKIDSSYYPHLDSTIVRKNTYVDSVVVEETEKFNKKEYYRISTYRVGDDNSFSFSHAITVRDSGDYIVNEKGEILMSHSNFSDTLHKVYHKWAPETFQYFKAENTKEQFCTNLGCFSGINYKSKMYNPDRDMTLVDNYIYVKGIGKLYFEYSCYSCLSTTKTVYKLTRYSLSDN